MQLSGDWKIGSPSPSAETFRTLIASESVREISFQCNLITGWDSTLVTFLRKLQTETSKNDIHLNFQGLPLGVQRLLALASAVPEKVTPKKLDRSSIVTQIGERTLDLIHLTIEMITFVGEFLLAFWAFLIRKARYRRNDLAATIESCGPKAFPIVALISILIGMILAFVGLVQLKMFGAQMYVADLVGLGMAREMGAMMTAIIMAGRTGAAFAAQLGSMEVNEEIDAYKTLGFAPMEFLVLPRMLALVLMMPLLCLYSDIIGIVGGALVGVGTSDVSWIQYYNETKSVISLTDISIGIFKSIVFGFLISMSGCFHGLKCSRSSAAVGVATTSAVVTSIVYIIVFDCLITFVTTIIGI